ncbi:hypothetical protein F2Q69_00054982 [Brassica cretica]|uniref:DUF223 domain-containing protein n=1 Tax=Brassica cretica TaxID=69181 RepID=A0A8S9N140_BRACR|nr:hypothetical protein F2Q69_00054982 [Brassica cretica]
MGLLSSDVLIITCHISLKAGSIVKVDRFEVARCSSMYKMTDHPFLIRFILLTIIDEVITGAPEINLQSRLDYVVGQIRSVQGSDLTKERTRVVIRLLIDPCSSMYKITDHPFLIRFISLTIIDEVITGATEINLQSRLDYSKSPSDCEHKPRTPRALTSPKKQLKSLSVSSLIHVYEEDEDDNQDQ